MSSMWGPKTRKTSTQNVDTVDHSAYVRKTGARMTGRINMGGKKIVELAEPTEDQDAATARYVSQYVRGGTETNRERFADICNSRQSEIVNDSWTYCQFHALIP